jgi:hypothetical protein
MRRCEWDQRCTRQRYFAVREGRERRAARSQPHPIWSRRLGLQLIVHPATRRRWKGEVQTGVSWFGNIMCNRSLLRQEKPPFDENVLSIVAFTSCQD